MHAQANTQIFGLSIGGWEVTLPYILTGQILGFVSQGAFDIDVVRLAVVSLPLILGALWLGIRLRKRVDVDTYKGMLRGALWVISIGILVDALRSLA